MMLTPERMQRIRFLVHDSFRENFLTTLHELGNIHLTGRKERTSLPELEELLIPHATPEEAREVSSLLVTLNRILETFNSVTTQEESGLFETVFFPKTRTRTDVSEAERAKLLQRAKPEIEEVQKLVAAPVAQLENISHELDRLEKYHARFAAIRKVEVPLELFSVGPFAATVAGFVGKKEHLPLVAALKEALKERVDTSEVPLEEGDFFLMVSCLLEDREQCLTLAKRKGLDILDCGGFTGTPSEALIEIETQKADLQKTKDECRSQINVVAKAWKEKLRELGEALKVRQERLNLLSLTSRTGFVVLFEGWVPAGEARTVEKTFFEKSRGLVTCFVSEPDAPPERIPVKLKNFPVLQHFQPLTKLYALPRYDEFDPTPLMTITALFFFGLMITDALYGLMTLVLGVMILRGGGRTDPMLRSSGIMLSLAGASAVVLGALAGGWFGNLAVEHIGLRFLENIVLIDPMKQVSEFLVFAIIVGLIHLNFGIVLGIAKEIRRNDPRKALDHVWVFFFEAALVANYYEARTATLLFLVPGVLLLLYRQQGMAFFAITGFLGDTLSYARLMALGLVSFGLAFSINALAILIWDLGSFGWIAAVLILIIGHIFSWLLNVIGAFAHALRLHFVEFFGKFYEGGGEEFAPFRMRD